MLLPAQMEDWSAVNRIARQVCALHASWGSGMVVEIPYPMDYFQELVENRELYAAWDNGEIIGYIRFYFWQAGGPAAPSRKMVNIDDIGVEESFRNRGVGTKMMEEFCEIARHAGCEGLNLYVDAPNEGAIAFYKKCGLYIRNYGMSMTL